ncbi:UDP-glycosyltransferase 84B1-like [Mangifera indica]|uniref:UDP-glycosyltransferase 84B1-like n=1 Tax=Mangifera indica TaxID=29780 RepID=UPI001CFAFA28|nr:UDP-glycosyltransferase 84B1-like [Mangifera indica]
MDGEEEVHVLLVTLPKQGHINPMLRLAKRLVSKGLHAVLATTENERHRLLHFKASVTQQTNPPKTPTISLEFFSDGLSDEFDREKYLESSIESLQTIGSKNLSNLITKLKTKCNKISCIITNPFMPWVPGLAEEHGIPCAVLWIQASAVYFIYSNYFKHPYLFPSLDNPNDAVELPGMPMLLVKELPSFILPSSHICLTKLVSDFVQMLDKVKWILGNSFNELEKEIVGSMGSLQQIIPIGPLVPPFLLGEKEIIAASMDLCRPEDYCIEWLDKKPPSSVIYISFGSLIVMTQNQIDSIATALRKSCRQFLWVVKPPEKGCSKRSGEFPPGFLEDTKERGLVVKWCPQEKVLMHQAVACFMTHCGWNSTLETIATGVPVIAYPHWTDQSIDAKLLVDILKIGVGMKNEEDGTLSVDEVEKCIMEMTDKNTATEMKKRAIFFKEAAKKAVANGGSSDRNLDTFINEIQGKSF